MVVKVSLERGHRPGGSRGRSWGLTGHVRAGRNPRAGETLYSHIKVAASTGTYQRFLDAIGAANEGAGSVRTQLGELSGRCP